MELLTGNHSNGRLLAFSTNITQRSKRKAAANSVDYYDTATITTVKSHIVKDPLASLSSCKGLAGENTLAYLFGASGIKKKFYKIDNRIDGHFQSNQVPI